MPQFLSLLLYQLGQLLVAVVQSSLDMCAVLFLGGKLLVDIVELPLKSASLLLHLKEPSVSFRFQHLPMDRWHCKFVSFQQIEPTLAIYMHANSDFIQYALVRGTWLRRSRIPTTGCAPKIVNKVALFPLDLLGYVFRQILQHACKLAL